ncbi:hypothetical protein ES707_21308 [subsurface metagenome]|jgi:hypothetical protein
MVTTVSTTTVTTVTAIAAMGLTAALSIAATVLLISFLTTKELASARGYGFSSRVARFITIAIVPLVMAFVVITGVAIAGVLT